MTRAARRYRLAAALTMLLVVAALAFPVVRAQRGGRRGRTRIPPPSPVLAAVTSLRCSFPAAASATWQGDKPQAQLMTSPAPLSLTFTDIDAQEGTAAVAGTGAPVQVTVTLVGSNLHFLDISGAGALAVTTVFAQESHDGRLRAVHSRADRGSGTSRDVATPEASQYYGDCEIASR